MRIINNKWVYGIGIVIFIPYVFSMFIVPLFLPGFFQDSPTLNRLFDTLHNWQSLNAGILAFIASAIVYFAMKKQLDFERNKLLNINIQDFTSEYLEVDRIFVEMSKAINPKKLSFNESSEEIAYLLMDADRPLNKCYILTMSMGESDISERLAKWVNTARYLKALLLKDDPEAHLEEISKIVDEIITLQKEIDKRIIDLTQRTIISF